MFQQRTASVAANSISVFFKDFLFLFMLLYVYMYATRVWVPEKAKGIRSPGGGVRASVGTKEERAASALYQRTIFPALNVIS